MILSVVCVYTLSYKYDKQTQLLKLIINSDFENSFEFKKKALTYLIAPDCMLYLTRNEIMYYIALNDSIYGNEIHHSLREMAERMK